MSVAGRSNSDNNKHWNTPPSYAKLVEDFFGTIDLDPCSNEFSLVKSKSAIMLPDDGLSLNWTKGNVFVNPPYGKDYDRGTSIKDWYKKITQEYKDGCEVIVLAPVASNTSYWRNYVFGCATSICFIYEPRVKFYLDGDKEPKGCPVACCFIYYGDNSTRFKEVFNEVGYCVELLGNQIITNSSTTNNKD
jgi:hypothetical protein